MDIQKVILRTNRIVAVLPQYIRADMENVVTLLGEQQEQIQAQAETILEQREQLAQARSRACELTKALDALNYPTASLWQEASRDMVI